MKPADWRILVVAGLVLWPVAAIADGPEIVYYDVAGNSTGELQSQLNGKGPPDDGGKRWDATTKWNVAWSYRFMPEADSCRITELDVSLTATTILPRWTPGRRASRSLVKKWQDFVAALRTHEDGHYAHGVSAAEEIRSFGQSFRVPGGCSTIARQFNEQAASIVDKYKAVDATYDVDTRHGRTQGAWFP